MEMEGWAVEAWGLDGAAPLRKLDLQQDGAADADAGAGVGPALPPMLVMVDVLSR